MKENTKTKNSARNVVFGFGLKIYQLLMPFVVRTIIIKVLGMEYAGLNSLFTSILQVLNIAELGVSSALVFSMYKPVAEHDTIKICALMQLYKVYYRIIGLVILVLGGILTPFVPNLINGSVPSQVNIYILYWMNLGATVLSYWLFAYKNSLLQVHQRNDIISKVTIITDTIKYALQIGLLFAFKNYYLYLMVLMIIQIANNLLIALITNKKYPLFRAYGDLSKEERKTINSSIRDLFYSKIGYVVTNSVDSIVISAFLGLLPLAIYQNYFYILNALLGFFNIFFTSCRASLGNNLITKTESDNYKDLRFITFIVLAALAFCIPCLITMYQPFIEIWVGSENKLEDYFVFLFGVYLLITVLHHLIELYKDAAGKWHRDRFRPLLTALVNLGLNISLVNIIGISGILLSTIGAFLLLDIPWLYVCLFRDVFNKKYSSNYLGYISYKLGVVVVVSVICWLVCTPISLDNLYGQFFLNFSICLIISVFLYIILNFWDKSLIRCIDIVKGKILKVPKKN